MSYLALYRRYRPQTFDKLVGQEHIVKTLVNQIESDKIGHAYLFCGTRGTGKTTAAKIFSKAINCLHPVNGSPCGECEVCRALADASNLDVVEIDAASNNGVNEIRDLRDKITYPPVSCRYKVYIIDEVHMLTLSAFNALLKTLEEPPKHAVFILATTEAHKLPATILSRCMRFDFKLISTERIAKLIGEIFKDIGKEYEEEAVMRIAKAGEGSIRDALSIADICVSVSKGKLTYADVLEVLGTSNVDKINALVSAVIDGDAGKVLTTINELASMGKSMGLLVKDITSTLRDLLVIKTCKDPNGILAMPTDIFNGLKEIADKTSAERLLRILEVFSSAESELRYSTHPRIILETVAVKASKPETDFDIGALTSRITALETAVKNGEIKVISSAPQKAVEESTVAPSVKEEVSAIKEKTHTAGELMGLITTGLRKSGELMLWAVVQSLKATLNGNVLTITATSGGDQKILENSLETIENQISGLGITVKVKTATDGESVKEFENDVDEMKKIFGDDIVIVK